MNTLPGCDRPESLHEAQTCHICSALSGQNSRIRYVQCFATPQCLS